jgi:LPS-assembly protein
MRQANDRFPLTDARVRRTLRLLPLPLCIGLSFAAHAAEDRPDEWRLCPIQDAVPAFPDAPQPQGVLQQNPQASGIAGNPPGTSAVQIGAPTPGTGNQAQASPPQAGVQPAATPATPAVQDRTKQPTDIEGDRLAGTESTPQFEGNVALRRGDQFLGTRKLTYDSDTGKYVAEGDVRYQDAGMRMVADRAEGDQNADTHDVQNVRYQLMSRRGNGGAEHIEMHGSQGSLYGATYSTCPPDDRRWELRAHRIDIDTDAGTGVARNAVLKVGRVPVLYVPWFPFPIDNRRRTGLLSPSIGSSNRNGFDYRQPYYINLAPNYDMTVTPRLMTKRGLQLGTEFRYLTNTGRGVFDFAYLPNDKLTDRERADEDALFAAHPQLAGNGRKDNRGFFRFVGLQNVNHDWQARANLNWISDPRYLEDFNNNLNGLTPFSISSNIGLYGRGQYWDASFTADYNLLADYTLTKAALPYNRLPRAALHWDQPITRWFDAGVDAEAVRFQDPVKPGATRLDLKPFVSLPLEGASWYITPTLAWRYTAYQMDGALAEQIAQVRANEVLGLPTTTPQPANVIAPFYNRTPTRSLPVASVDAGLYFDRDTIWGGSKYLQTLEPRLFYLRAPYRDQSDLPLLDTRPLTFSWGQLFRDNRYTGADRQTDANQVTVALTSRWIRQSDGQEKLSTSLGQIRYLTDSRVVTVPCISPGVPAICEPVQSGNSAWVADANWSVNDRWTVGGAYQWDPKFRRQDLASLRTRYLIGDDGIVNFGYRYRRNLLKQVDLNFLYPVTSSWSLVGRYYYSLFRHADANPALNQKPQLLEGIIGVQWDSCCMAVRLVGRRYISGRTLTDEPHLNNAIQLEFELKGLGSAGPDTESRLRHAILGYNREDLYLVPPSEVTGSGADSDSPDITP